jgi:hypothetical protein
MDARAITVVRCSEREREREREREKSIKIERGVGN